MAQTINGLFNKSREKNVAPVQPRITEELQPSRNDQPVQVFTVFITNFSYPDQDKMILNMLCQVRLHRQFEGKM